MKSMFWTALLGFIVSVNSAFAQTEKSFDVDEVLRECLSAPDASLVDCARVTAAVTGSNGVKVVLEFNYDNDAAAIETKGGPNKGCCKGFHSKTGIGFGCAPPQNDATGALYCPSGTYKASCGQNYYTSCTRGAW